MEHDPLPGGESQTSGLVPAESRCLGCAYHLTGLRRDGQCPECGKAVEESIRFGLSAQPVGTLSRIRAGVIWIFVGLGAQFAVGMVGSMFIFAAVAAAQSSMASGIVLAGVGTALAIGAQVVSLIGYWKFSTPLAGAKPKDWKHGGYRRTLRVTSVVIVLLAIFNTPLGFVVAFTTMGGMTVAGSGGAGAASGPPMSTGGMVALGLNAAVGLVAGLAELVRYLSTAAYTHALASRLPDPALATVAMRVYRWTAGLIIGAIALIALSTLLAAITVGASGSVGALGFFPGLLGMLVIVVVAFVLWIVWIVMLAKFLAAISKVRTRVLRRARDEDGAPA